MDDINLHEILSLEKHRFLLRNLDTGRTSDIPEGIGVGEDKWDIEGMVTAKKVATSGTRGKFREIQRVFENSGEAVSTTIVDVLSYLVSILKQNAKIR